MNNGAMTVLLPMNVILTVRNFRDAILGPLCGGSLTEHNIALPDPLPKCFLKTLRSPNDTIFVACPGAILRFHLLGAGAEYRTVGLAFTRAEVAEPTAVVWGIGSVSIPGSPFTVVGFPDGVLEVKDNVPPGDGAKQHKFYKFSLVIQRQNDGAIGIIDPYLENEN